MWVLWTYHSKRTLATESTKKQTSYSQWKASKEASGLPAASGISSGGNRGKDEGLPTGGKPRKVLFSSSRSLKLRAKVDKSLRIRCQQPSCGYSVFAGSQCSFNTLDALNKQERVEANEALSIPNPQFNTKEYKIPKLNRKK